MGMNGSPERGGGKEAQVVGFKEAPPFGRGASLIETRMVKKLIRLLSNIFSRCLRTVIPAALAGGGRGYPRDLGSFVAFCLAAQKRTTRATGPSV